MNRNILVGIIFSEFDDRYGPKAITWYPSELDEETTGKVSDITINHFMEEDIRQEMLYFVPYLKINKKGLVRTIIWPETKKRGWKAMSTLTLLFEEINDLIFYKYQKDLEEPLDRVAKKIIDLRKTNSNVKEIQKTLEDLQAEIIHILENLSKQELQLKDQVEEFPKSKTHMGLKIDYNFKIIVVGDPSVGKTSTILRFSDNAFRRSYLPTIGVNMSQKYIPHGDKIIQLILWDLAGQSKYQETRSLSYQGAHGAIMVYDLTDRQTFDNISKWHDDIMRSMGDESIKIHLILCGNKKDLADKRTVSTQEGKELARKLQINFFETSALTGENINQAFLQLVETLLTQSSPEVLNK